MDAKTPSDDSPAIPDTGAMAGKSARVMRAIRRIMRAVDIQSKRVSRGAGLTIPQIVILQTLHERGPMSTGGLAAEISLSPPTVTTILDRLEGRRLVRRTRNAADRRVVLTELTEEGRAVLGRAPPLLHQGFLTAFASMDSSRQDDLVTALDAIADLMDEAPVPPALLLEKEDGGGTR